tara:strand:+ start:415 stop:1278 length:864 start_codon:yes stop_codon:yes gene_type:complete
MTGYGSFEQKNDDLILKIEIRSLNSRYLDFSPRLPRTLSSFEDDAYKLIKQTCSRGRITLTANIEFLQNISNGVKLNHDRLNEYMSAVEEINKASDKLMDPNIGDILRFPEILSKCDTVENRDLKEIFISVLKNALFEMEKTKSLEGKNIQIDINKRIAILQSVLKEIQTCFEINRKEIFKKYKQKIQKLIEDISIDDVRLNQEIAIIIEKKDITEEIVRLNSHFDLVIDYLDENKNNGKKINFLLQEIGREINTISSKSDNVKISHLAVDMKDELEKIREQVQNIV